MYRTAKVSTNASGIFHVIYIIYDPNVMASPHDNIAFLLSAHIIPTSSGVRAWTSNCNLMKYTIQLLNQNLTSDELPI